MCEGTDAPRIDTEEKKTVRGIRQHVVALVSATDQPQTKLIIQSTGRVMLPAQWKYSAVAYNVVLSTDMVAMVATRLANSHNTSNGNNDG